MQEPTVTASGAMEGEVWKRPAGVRAVADSSVAMPDLYRLHSRASVLELSASIRTLRQRGSRENKTDSQEEQ